MENTQNRKRARYEGDSMAFSSLAANGANPGGQLVPLQSSLVQSASLSHLSTEALLQIASERSDFSLVIKHFSSVEDRTCKSSSLDDLLKAVFAGEVEVDDDFFKQLRTFKLQEIKSRLLVIKDTDSYLLERFEFDNKKTERIMSGAMANALRGSTESLAEAKGVVKQVVKSLLEISSGDVEQEAQTCRTILNQWKDHSKTQERRLTTSLKKETNEIELIDKLLHGNLSKVSNRFARLINMYSQQGEIITKFVGNLFSNRTDKAQWNRMKEFFPSTFQQELLLYAPDGIKAALSPLQLDSIVANLPAVTIRPPSFINATESYSVCGSAISGGVAGFPPELIQEMKTFVQKNDGGIESLIVFLEKEEPQLASVVKTKREYFSVVLDIPDSNNLDSNSGDDLLAHAETFIRDGVESVDESLSSWNSSSIVRLLTEKNKRHVKRD